MTEDKQRLLNNLYRNHQDRLTKHFLGISFAYLALSLLWNELSHLINLDFARANISVLSACLAMWAVVFLLYKRKRLSSGTLKHMTLIYMTFVLVCLYFGSGYSESWGFFLLLPLLTGLYGERRMFFIYSCIGSVLLVGTSALFLRSSTAVDAVDIANRLLLYLIIATLSHLLFKQLNLLYKKQVHTVISSMEGTIEQVVQSFIISIEAKDAYTFGHSERVSKYAVALASWHPRFQDDKKIQSLRMCGLLHDIGKINIPEHVLAKTASLTADEYELIKTHTLVGSKMVEKITGLGPMKPGVLYHHERWDGTGYPSRLKGEDIPLEARILALADAFDAMTSDRSYRRALSVQEAFRRIEEGRGTQFDPELVDLVNQMQLVWVRIHRDSNDPISEMEKMTDFL